MKRQRRTLSKQQANYQQLENRTLLAGMVFVDISGGNLFIIGDNLDNAVSVDLSATTTAALVQGQDGTGVRYSDQFDNGFSLDGIRDVRVYSQAGDDIVTLFANDFSVDDDLIASLGPGDDSLYVVGGEFESDVRVFGGAGHDSISFNRTNVGDDLSIYANAGKDVITLNRVDVDDQSRLFGQFGHDTILVCDSLFGHQAYVEMGAGADRYESTNSVYLDQFSIRGRLGADFFASDESNDFTLERNVQTIERELSETNINGKAKESLDQMKSAFFAVGSELSTEVGDALQDDLSAVAAAFNASLVDLHLDAESQTVSVEDPTPSISVLWDQAVQDAVAATGPGPTIASRAYAILHTAMYDAWSAYDELAISTQRDDDLQRPANEDNDTNKIEAMSYAAFHVLDDLFSPQSSIFIGLMDELGFDAANQTTDATTAAGIGNLMAKAVLEFRHDDGSNQLGDAATGTSGVAYSDTTGYTPINDVGNPSIIDAWTPEYVPVDSVPGSEDRFQQFLTPHWGNVTMFGIESSDEILPPAPKPFLLVDADVDLDARTITLTDGTVLDIDRSLVGTVINPEFIAQAEEVIEYSAELTDEQKLIAEFWEDGGGTSFPPGTFMTFGELVSARDNNSIDDDAKMFFALSNAIFDAGVATWEAKVHYDYVRPVRAIRELGELGLIGELNSDLGGYAIEAWTPDGNMQTILATEFLTYQTPGADVSPPFAEYTSGHSAFSAAGATILELFTGSETFGASVTFGAGESRFEPGVTPVSDTMLAWDTFTAAADEAGESRLYGGIHFEDGDVYGRDLGNAAGDAAWQQAQLYITGGIATQPH